MSTATTRLPDLLRLARQRQGLTRRACEEKANLAPGSWIDFEFGRTVPTESMASGIARALGCNVRSVLEEIRRATK